MRQVKPPEGRLVLTVVAVAALLDAALLVRQTSDYVADAGQPALRHGDLTSALASVAMLALLGLIGFNTVRKARR